MPGSMSHPRGGYAGAAWIEGVSQIFHQNIPDPVSSQFTPADSRSESLVR